MAILAADDERARRAAGRSCGTCSLCCTLLRVDELSKAAGRDCVHQQRPRDGGSGGDAGCGIYASRPPICRGYRCLWLQGGLEDDERPDRTGGIVDLESRGTGVMLRIQEVRRGAFDASPSLRAIADRYRDEMPVRVSDAEDVEDPDRPFRVLLSGGLEQRVAGEWVETWRDGVFAGRERQPWAERLARRLGLWWRGRALARIRRGEATGRASAPVRNPDDPVG